MSSYSLRIPVTCARAYQDKYVPEKINAEYLQIFLNRIDLVRKMIPSCIPFANLTHEWLMHTLSVHSVSHSLAND